MGGERQLHRTEDIENESQLIEEENWESKKLKDEDIKKGKYWGRNILRREHHFFLKKKKLLYQIEKAFLINIQRPIF